jgi:hypothetical protein
MATMGNLTHDLGSQLCTAWGIEPNECKRIEVVFDAERPIPFAIITMRLNEEVIRTLLQLQLRKDNAGDILRISMDGQQE